MIRQTVLHISGADASAFLQAQFTLGVSRMRPGQHGMTAWCDANGRALMLGQLAATRTGFYLRLPAELAETVIRRLKMFVLRARVHITELGDSWRCCWLTQAQIERHFPAFAGPLEPGEFAALDDCLLVKTRSDGLEVWGPTAEIQPLIASEQAMHAAWARQRIHAGLPMITAATAGQFLPQMLNLHWLRGLEFDKGCYPGQEVIARLQYRGKLKRRLYRLAAPLARAPHPGDSIQSPQADKAGTVLEAAPGDPANEGFGLTAVLESRFADAPLFLQDSLLTVLDLPYATAE